MATLRNNEKMAALNNESYDEHPRSNLAQNSNVSGPQEDYITQVSEEIEGRVTKKLPQEFSRTENRILGALARLDDLLMIPLIQGHSGTAPETSRNAFGSNQETYEDDSQNDPHPEANIFRRQTTQNYGPEIGHDSWHSFTFITLIEWKQMPRKTKVWAPRLLESTVLLRWYVTLLNLEKPFE